MAARRDLACLAALVLFALLLCHQAVAGRVYFERDVFAVWHSQVEAFVRCVAAGSWPLWDPWTGFGQPMLANPSAQVFYPPSWLNLLMPPALYYSLYVVAHLAFAGVGLYLLTRRLGLGREAALGAAAIWMGSGPLLSLVNVWHHFAGAAWMPWVLLGLHECLTCADWGRAALAGTALAGQVLAGSPDLCAMTLLIAIPFALAQLGAAGRARRVARLALYVATAAGLSAGQWLTTLGSALGSTRFDLAAAKRVAWSVHPLSLAQLVLPVSFERIVVDAPWSEPLFDLWSPFLASLYLGLPAALLVAASFTAPRAFRNLFAACAALLLLFALGRYAPFHEAALVLLPPLKVLRYPAKAMPAVALCWAVLAGMGLEALSAARPRRILLLIAPLAGAGAGVTLFTLAPSSAWLHAQWPALLLTLGAAALALVLAWRRPWAVGALLAALAALDLAAAHWGLNRTTRREFYAERPELVARLQGPAPVRLHVWDYVMPVPGLERSTPNRVPVLMENPPGWPQKVGTAMAMQSYLYPPSAARFGFYGSYDPDLLDLGGRRAYDVNLLVRASAGTPAYARLMRIGAVDAVLALHDAGVDGLERLPDARGLYSEPIRVFRVSGSLPKTYAAGAARFADDPEALKRLVDPDFEPGRDVVLAGSGMASRVPGFDGRVLVLDERPDRIRVETATNAPGYVVRVDADAPGWSVRVDGVPATPLRANVLFRAVAVPAGRHLVEWTYRPPAAIAGAALSLVSLAALTILALRRGLQRPAATS